MRRVCAEYAQIFFPGSAAGIPGTLASLGNLGSAAGMPGNAPGVSDRISWTVQASESSSSVGRAQGDSTQRGGPRKVAEKAKPIGDAGHFQTHLHREFVYSKVDAVTVCQAECYLMVSRVT